MRALLVVLLLPLAQAAIVMEDDSGDQAATVANQPFDADRYPYADLISASIEETNDDFTVHLTVAEIDRQTAEVDHFLTWVPTHVHFTYDESQYAVEFVRISRPADDFVEYRASLHSFAQDEYDFIATLPVELDLSTETVSATIDRDEIFSADGAPAQRDHTITDFFAILDVQTDIFSDGLGVPSTHGVYDRMPDDGFSGIDLVLQYGIGQTGHAFLASEEPFRVSNGEATTFVFEIEATNKDDAQDAFRFSADAPADWIVTLPERLQLDGGQTTNLPVLVTVPFKHQHDSVSSFVLEMTSQTDPDSVGRLEMGVRYTAVPQPAGHHNELFLHSWDQVDFAIFGNTLDVPFLQGSPAFMNTIEKYEGDARKNAPPYDVSCEATEQTYTYAAYLSPNLAMGLDFDLDALGDAEITMQTPLPSQSMKAYGELYVLPPGTKAPMFGLTEARDQWGEHMVAELLESNEAATDAGGSATLEMTIQPTEEGDYVPHQPGNYMLLLIHVHDVPLVTPIFCVTGAGNEPTIMPGGSLRLPLVDYHDSVSEYFAAASGVDLYSTSLLKQMANPGESVLFNVSAEGTGDEKGRYELSLTGANAEWAHIIGPSTVGVKPGEIKAIQVAVAVPDGTLDGVLADISLIATRADDPNVQSVLRMVTEVDVDADHADATATVESLSASDNKQSPGPSIALLAALLLVRRRMTTHR